MRTAQLASIAALPFVCGLSSAQQAAPSSVQIYGIVDACVVRSDTGAQQKSDVSSGCQNGSRLGFRGTEDLGGGLRAHFNLESGFAMDTGTLAQGGRIFGRKAIVGLGHSRFTIEAGRDYAPAFYLIQPVDPMGLGVGSASNTLWTGSPSSTAARSDNAVNLLTSWSSHWSARLQYALGEQAAPLPARGRDGMGLNLMYRDGATLAGLSYARLRNSADDASDAAWTLAASHRVGAWTLAGIYQRGAWEGSRPATAPSSRTSLFSRDYHSLLVGLTWQAHATGTVSASYKRYDDRTVANLDATQWSVNYVHQLSKRSALYAAWTSLGNSGLSTYGASDASVTYAADTSGADSSVLALGIRHQF